MTSVPALKACGVAFRYSRKHAPVLDGLDFEIASGAVTALIGVSGSGKSTLLYILGLLLRPSAGSIEVHGIKTSGLSDSKISQIRSESIGFLFQDALLDPTRTVADNIGEGLLFARKHGGRSSSTVREMLASVGLDNDLLARRLPKSISGGQAQRVALCRALMKNPSIVLADEPTGNLDRTSSASVLRALRKAAHDGAAVCIATHDDNVVGSADSCIDLSSITTSSAVEHAEHSWGISN